MNRINRGNARSFSLAEAIQARIVEYLQGLYDDAEGFFGDLDTWSQRSILDENLAKLALILESDQPAEACYQHLIREIDAEAGAGVFLARPDADLAHLRFVADDPGVSGALHREMPAIAPLCFADAAADSAQDLDLDLVWVSVRARHDRAHVDASVSQIVMSCLADDGATALDMTNAMRGLQYAYHEDVVRRRCGLPVLLDERERRELTIMVSNMIDRAGGYRHQVVGIRSRAGTARTIPSAEPVSVSAHAGGWWPAL